MNKIVSAMAAALMFFSTAAQAEPVAYPGSAWINVSGPQSGGEESGNWVVSSRVEQGVEWIEIEGWRLNTSVSVSVSADTKGFDWNNRVSPSATLSLRRLTDSSVFEIGVQATNQTRFGSLYRISDRSTNGVQVFASYWTGWGR